MLGQENCRIINQVRLAGSGYGREPSRRIRFQAEVPRQLVGKVICAVIYDQVQYTRPMLAISEAGAQLHHGSGPGHLLRGPRRMYCSQLEMSIFMNLKLNRTVERLKTLKWHSERPNQMLAREYLQEWTRRLLSAGSR